MVKTKYCCPRWKGGKSTMAWMCQTTLSCHLGIKWRSKCCETVKRPKAQRLVDMQQPQCGYAAAWRHAAAIQWSNNFETPAKQRSDSDRPPHDDVSPLHAPCTRCGTEQRNALRRHVSVPTNPIASSTPVPPPLPFPPSLPRGLFGSLQRAHLRNKPGAACPTTTRFMPYHHG